MNVVQARRYARRQRSAVRGDAFPLGGGLNEIDSPLSIAPGELIYCSNYEPRLRQGYSRLTGYEAFDGHPRPNDAEYWRVDYVEASSTFAVDDEIETDAVPSIEGRVLAVVESDSGATNNAPYSYDLSEWSSNVGTTNVDDQIFSPVQYNGSSTLTGWTIQEQATSGEHYIEEVYSGISDTETWTISVYVIDGDIFLNHRGKVRVQVRDPTGKLVDIRYDTEQHEALNPGSEITSGVTASYAVTRHSVAEDSVNVYTRFEITFTARATADHTVRVSMLDDEGNIGYLGDVTKKLCVTGLQIEQSSSAYGYIETDGAAVSIGSGYLILDNVTGDIEDGDKITELGAGAPYRMTVSGDAVQYGAPTVPLDRHYRELAAIKRRADIDAVPGEGPVRGVCLFEGNLYAFRDKVGGATAGIYKSTASGWDELDLGNAIHFDAGTGLISAGDTVTGALSGASALVRKVLISSGSWATGDAAGHLILGTVSGGPFQNNEGLQVAGPPNDALADGVDYALTQNPGGKYEFRVHNFFGHSSQVAMYGVNGTDEAFVIDNGDVFSHIETGMTTDTPEHIEIYRDQLVLSFQGGSIQYSGVGAPYSWSVIVGAGEIGVGDECTGLLYMPGQALFAFTRDEIHFFQGTLGGSDFYHDRFAQTTGAHQWTIQPMGQGVFLDDRGFSLLATVDRKGDYVSTTISQKIQKTLKVQRPLIQDSVINRERSLARYFSSDGTMISIGFDAKQVTGFTTSKLPITVYCSVSDEDAAGTERTFLGCEDGYVYEMDVGWNFSGDPITAYMVLAFNHQNSPSLVKRYRRGQFEVDADGDVTLRISSLPSGGDPAYPATNFVDAVVQGGGGLWNVSNWNQFRWNSGGILPLGLIKIEGSGTNVSLVVWHEETEQLPHDLNSVVLHYSPRRLERRTLAY